MAKQLVNPIERHLEKGVLAVAGLLLIGVVVVYVVGSPNKLELGGETVSPSNIDSMLAAKAAAVRDRIRNARANVEMPEPLYDSMLGALDPYKRAGLPLAMRSAVPIGPRVPIVDANEAGAGRVELATLVPVSTPAVTFGRSTFQVETLDGFEPRAANWVTVSAVFEVKAQTDRLRRQYGARRKQVIFGPPQLQRRTRRADGSWRDEDWEDIEGWASPPVTLPAPPTISLREEGGKIVVSAREQADIAQYFDRLNEPVLQLGLLRPLLPPISNGDPWDFPEITTRRDVLLGDDQYLFPDKPPDANPADRYRGEEDVRVAVEEELTRAQQLQAIEKRLDEAAKNLSGNDAMSARNDAFDIQTDIAASPSERKEATRLVQKADDIGADIRRELRRPKVRVKQEEELVSREPRPTQQFWVHDAKPGSVEGGRTYQYRIRAAIAHLLAGYPDRFRDPLHAGELFLYGDWSAPIEVTIPRDMWFFVTSKDARNHQVGVEFYRWFEGHWVKAPRRVKVGLGDRIRTDQRTVVQSPDDPEETERPTVTYEADAAVVDIDFNRTFRERKKGKGRGGVKFGQATTACCVVMADSAGRLHERFVAMDKLNPRKKIVAERVWKPARR